MKKKPAAVNLRGLHFPPPVKQAAADAIVWRGRTTLKKAGAWCVKHGATVLREDELGVHLECTAANYPGLCEAYDARRQEEEPPPEEAGGGDAVDPAPEVRAAEG